MVDRNAETLRRVEVITGSGRRRRWSMEAKLRVVAESLAEDAVVSEVARRHGLKPQQLFDWRRQMRACLPAASRNAVPGFAPVIVEEASTKSATAASPEVVEIEIVVGGAVIRIRGDGGEVLASAIKALRSPP